MMTERMAINGRLPENTMPLPGRQMSRRYSVRRWMSFRLFLIRVWMAARVLTFRIYWVAWLQDAHNSPFLQWSQSTRLHKRQVETCCNNRFARGEKFHIIRKTTRVKKTRSDARGGIPKNEAPHRLRVVVQEPLYALTGKMCRQKYAGL